jgi:succinate dehydrogenase / fumarate reductase flavoprotein subunit
MESGVSAIQALHAQFSNDLRIQDRSLLWNNELVDAYETENLLLQAIATLTSALARKESRGAHWRADFPSADDANGRAHSVVFVSEHGKARLHTRPVRVYSQVQTQHSQGSNA